MYRKTRATSPPGKYDTKGETVNSTSIEWCNRPETRGVAGAKTWNPIRARLKGDSHKARSGTFCTRISPGCAHCYASTINKRFGNGLEFTVPNLEQIEFFVDERILQEPLKQKKPCTIFVGDMFDLFHEAILDGMIQRVFGTAICAEQHTFQFLTKRAERMQSLIGGDFGVNAYGPPRNVWLGVSVESQKYADERIPLLLQTPAAVRFLSVEPQLEAVDVSRYMWPACWHWDSKYRTPQEALAAGAYAEKPQALLAAGVPLVSWVICGGESGPGARPFNLAWAESIQSQCRAANVPFFMKQMGSRPHSGTTYIRPPNPEPGEWVEPWLNLKDRKGGDPSEWPEPLRVREFPTVREAVSA